VLRPGFVLPPLMFSDEEIEALVLGSRWVAQRTDEPLARAAANAIAKIAAVLPDDLRDSIEHNGLLAGPGTLLGPDPERPPIDLAPIRQAIRTERKLVLSYADAKAGTPSAQSGRSRSVSSTACGCSRPGASCARTIGTSAPTASPRCA